MRTMVLLGAVAVAVGLGGIASADPQLSKLTLKPRPTLVPHIAKLASVKPLTPAQKFTRYQGVIKGLPGIVFKTFELEAPVTFTARKLFIDSATFADVVEGTVLTSGLPGVGYPAPEPNGAIHVSFGGGLAMRFLAAANRIYVVDCILSDSATVNAYRDLETGGTVLGSGTMTPSDGHAVYALPPQPTSRPVLVVVGPQNDIVINQCELVPAVTTQ